MSRTRRTLIGLLAAALMVGAFPLTASAQSTDNSTTSTTVRVSDENVARALEAAKDRVRTAVDNRLGALARLGTRVDDADYVSGDHAAALHAEYNAATAVLTDGLDSVDAATTFEELLDVSPAIFEDTLVFALLGPKTHTVIAADTVAGATTRFDEYATRLQAALDQLSASGADTTGAQNDLDTATGLVADAAAAAAPVTDSVIGLQPGDDIRGPLENALGVLGTSRRQLDDARKLMVGVTGFILDNIATGTSGA
jgi:hypothetical protein